MEIPHLKDEGLINPKGSQSFDLAPCVTTCLESHHPNHWVGGRKNSFQREVQSSVHSEDIVSGPTDKPMCSSLEGLNCIFIALISGLSLSPTHALNHQ